MAKGFAQGFNSSSLALICFIEKKIHPEQFAYSSS